MCPRIALLTLCLVLAIDMLVFPKVNAQQLRLHSDMPYFKGQKSFIDIFYSSDSSFRGSISISLFKFLNESDSILVLKKDRYMVSFKKGNKKVRIPLRQRKRSPAYQSEEFFEILKRLDAVAPGYYKMQLVVSDTAMLIRQTICQEIDSMLSGGSKMRKNINGTLDKKAKRYSRKGSIANPTAGMVIKNSRSNIASTIKNKGLTAKQYEQNGKDFTDLYYKTWFAGRYELIKGQSITEHLKDQQKHPLAGFDNINPAGMERPSLISQFKSQNKAKNKEQEQITGLVGLTTYASTGQEPSSSMDNNYYELRGSIELPIMGIPIEVQGLYTSQDNNRRIKSSYVHVHYDVNKVKDGLRKSISSYNSKFSENKSKAAGLKQVYQSAIGRLENQKARIEHESDISSAGNGQGKSERLGELDKKIARYKQLLQQSENAGYFDSAMAYSKTRNLDGLDLSNKQMLKKANEIFPDSKAKGFLSGISTFDAGMFPKSESRHTMDGQMIKGGDLSYDLGYCEAGATVGKTEYVGRDGTLDKYTCYSGRVAFRPEKTQKITLLYYGYSPDRKVIDQDAFFGSLNLSAPTFMRPVHILSANYAGAISNYANITGEVATSYRAKTTNEGASANAILKAREHQAYDFAVDATIPTTAVCIEAAYDKTGKNFENNTVPLSLAGTEQYKLGVRNDFFSSFLTVGVDYNKLIQRNLSSNGSSTKWGFDIKTNSQRYPSITLSYKPFTTFRSYTDTLIVPQKPLFGAVWTGKISYQFKKNKKSWRFTVLYNKSTTVADSLQYSSKLAQVSCNYSVKRFDHTITVGATENSDNSGLSIAPPKTSFLSHNSSVVISKDATIGLGQDWGYTDFGLCRYSPNTSISYGFRKIPITCRVNMRYNRYKLNRLESWKTIYSGMFDVVYKIKYKMPMHN